MPKKPKPLEIKVGFYIANAEEFEKRARLRHLETKALIHFGQLDCLMMFFFVMAALSGGWTSVTYLCLGFAACSIRWLLHRRCKKSGMDL